MQLSISAFLYLFLFLWKNYLWLLVIFFRNLPYKFFTTPLMHGEWYGLVGTIRSLLVCTSRRIVLFKSERRKRAVVCWDAIYFWHTVCFSSSMIPYKIQHTQQKSHPAQHDTITDNSLIVHLCQGKLDKTFRLNVFFICFCPPRLLEIAEESDFLSTSSPSPNYNSFSFINESNIIITPAPTHPEGCEDNPPFPTTKTNNHLATI